jgi:hypothetical protein
MILFSPTVQELGSRIILTPMKGLAAVSLEGGIANRQGRAWSWPEEIMQHQQAVCLEVRKTEERKHHAQHERE